MERVAVHRSNGIQATEKINTHISQFTADLAMQARSGYEQSRCWGRMGVDEDMKPVGQSLRTGVGDEELTQLSQQHWLQC